MIILVATIRQQFLVIHNVTALNSTWSMNHTRVVIKGGRNEHDLVGERIYHPQENENKTKSFHTSNPQILDPLLASNSSQYTWMGDHFIPPRGVPTFGPDEYLSYFSRRNTLFIGDSLGRRAYGTLLGILTSNNETNIQTSELDSRSVIDFNEPRSSRQERCMITERSLHGNDQYVCRNILDHVRPSKKINNTSISTSRSNEDGETVENSMGNNTGKFDYIRHVCMKDIIHFFENNTESIQKDYDLVVLSLGIWDAKDQEHCRLEVPLKNEADGTVTDVIMSDKEKYDLTLDLLSSASSKNLQVVFRTPGKFHFSDIRLLSIDIGNFQDVQTEI